MKNQIYNNKKPEILNFVSDDDFKTILNLYKNDYYGKNFQEIELTIKKPYLYSKYEWSVLLQIIWTNQNYFKHLQEFQKIGIKKVKLICSCSCECCKNLLNKEIDIEYIKELPIKQCELNARLCLNAKYNPVIGF